MIKYFIIIEIVLLCQFQTTFSKEISQNQKATVSIKDVYDESEIKCLLVIDPALDQRSIIDVWNNIKQTAINVWNSIQHLAEDTKDKIKSWIENVKDEAGHIRQSIEKQLQELKTKVIAAIQNVFGDGEVVKKCLQKKKQNIDKELKKVISGVTDCISDKIDSLKNLEKYIGFILNDTDFVIKIEAKFNKCMEKEEMVEECLQHIRKEITDENNNTEKEILKQGVESRRFADDILNAVVTCSTQGLIEAAVVITSITLEILNCIIEG